MGGAQEIAGGANTFNATLWPPSYIGIVGVAGGSGGGSPPEAEDFLEIHGECVTYICSQQAQLNT